MHLWMIYDGMNNLKAAPWRRLGPPPVQAPHGEICAEQGHERGKRQRSSVAATFPPALTPSAPAGHVTR